MSKKETKRNRKGKPWIRFDLAAKAMQSTFPSHRRNPRVADDEIHEAPVAELTESRVAAGGAESSLAPQEATEALTTDELFSDQMRLMAKIGTGLWRLRRRMVKPGSDEPLDEVRRAYPHLLNVWEAIADAGFKIQDHTDDLYEPRMALIVVAVEPKADFDREKVIETLKPSMYFKDHCIQIGEVIVGVPVENVPPQDQSGENSELLS